LNRQDAKSAKGEEKEMKKGKEMKIKQTPILF
jgi:hypothetical protein